MNKIEKMLTTMGFDLDKLRCDETEYTVTNLHTAADLIKEAVGANRHIYVFADYDCDGVMAGSILYLILSHLGADFTIRFPKKMSEGYGISTKVIDEIPERSLIVTIDNGIAAIEAIELANSRGMDVIVLDHHEQRGDGILPDTACTVDPHVYKEENEFEHYCGAGLGHMLAKELELPDNIINETLVLASIATIQDVVPLVENNRNIVRNGLRLLNSKAVKLDGLYGLCSALKLSPTTDKYLCITEQDIAFQIGPCINAMGRMLDDGARLAFEYLMHYDRYGEDGINEMLNWNSERKKVTTQQQNMLEIEAARVKTKKTTCLVLCLPELHEGVIGINAAKCVELHNMPAIVLTEAENGMYKGSARSVDGINMKLLLDAVAEHVYAYGGHAGAAGLTIEKDKLDGFIKAINAVTPVAKTGASTWRYDVEITESEVAQIYDHVREYAPYGEGFPEPVFRVNNYTMVKNFGKYYRFVGENGVSFNGSSSEAISFKLKEKYQSLGTPLTLNIIGTLGYSKYSKKPQVLINDFQPIIKNQTSGFLV